MQSQAQPVRRAPTTVPGDGPARLTPEPVGDRLPLDPAPARRGAFGRAAARPGARRRREDAPVPALPAPLCLVPDVAESTAPGVDSWQGGLKRAIDVAGALTGLALCAPALAILALCIRAESPGPVLFSQTRIGRGGRPFRCYKLRTMRRDAEARLHGDAALRAQYEANSFKLPCATDDRITTIGRALRLSSLDELPQLWNVLRGDMSLVGPRPIVDRELGHYAAADRSTLLSVRPGITGAWAVAGRSRIGYPRRAAIELAYVRGWSTLTDLTILVRTLGAVIARRGAT